MKTTTKLLLGILIVLSIIVLLKYLEPKEIVNFTESSQQYLQGVIKE